MTLYEQAVEMKKKGERVTITKDDAFDAVDSYIKKLMDSGELAFIDFDSWEYEYALKLGAKYS